MFFIVFYIQVLLLGPVLMNLVLFNSELIVETQGFIIT